MANHQQTVQNVVCNVKTKLLPTLGQLDWLLVSGMCTKQNLEIDFSLSSFYCLFFFVVIPFFPLLLAFPLDLKRSKSFPETSGKWKQDQIFLRFCQSNLIGFSSLHVYIWPKSSWDLSRLSTFWKLSSNLLELVTKDIIYHKKGWRHKW